MRIDVIQDSIKRTFWQTENSHSYKTMLNKAIFRCGRFCNKYIQQQVKFENMQSQTNVFRTDPNKYAELVLCSAPQDESNTNSLYIVDAIKICEIF